MVFKTKERVIEMPKVLLYTKDERTFNVLFNQLHNYFHNALEILSLEQVEDIRQISLVLSTSYSLIEDIPCPPEKKLIVRRAINIAKLEELISLPEGTECLAISNLAEAANEMVELLYALGFNLKLYPYFPGAGHYPKTVEVAIAPSLLELVPPSIKRIIDIGIRPMDFSSLVEISVKLNIDMEKINRHTARYIQEIIKLSRKLSLSLKGEMELNHQLEAILNTVHDGIIATDMDKNIININRSAESILGLTSESLNNKITDLLPMLDLEDGDETRHNQLITISDKKIVVNKTTISMNDKNIGEVTAFQDVTRIQKLEHDIRKKMKEKGLATKYTIQDIIGKSEKIKEIISVMKKIAKTEQTVLILGENGTGKELFAQSIHTMSERKNGPFVPVNIAGLPESLAESELFGYEEGTFTGGNKGGKQGLFEIAHNGTIFLDEIGDASKSLQTLLLRALQEKQIMRVGGRSILPVDIRIIAATNKDLKKLVEEGRFREDLYYRLFVLPLRIPPLRERKMDIPELLYHFIKEFSLTQPKIADAVMEKLLNYNWPGNVRELINVVQYISIVMEGNQIDVKDLPEQFKSRYDASVEKEFITSLEEEGLLVDVYMILSCLKELHMTRKGIGRGRVVDYLNEKDFYLTEQQVRHRMKILSDFGLIYSGLKGQGSRILEKGLILHEMIENRLGYFKYTDS
ncbi:Fis family transcriptional regulator [Pullulanibacillus camelliae]|uniref:Fis family transcriptional regulator n=1 Tax=Pullulanibacillus camelliae TaxID=1707096 RepID=A0A8J2YIH2_9BACL|nr:sigma 54-interacting transcriptional regulator [Pullulanibacillus camelliae]GGE45053.1 Fis family transcriptional regulator [Pullulanibacillus camelliae]